MAIRVVAVDDSRIDRLRLVELLKHFDNVQLVAQKGDPEEAISAIMINRPDLVFLDIEMPKLSGFDIVDTIHKNGLFPTIVFVTAYEQYAIKAIRNRAFDYLLKPLDIDELSKTIFRYENDKNSVKPNLVSGPIENLSQREVEVLNLLIEGKTSREIAESLNISINTVNSHRGNLLKKTNSKNVAELIRWSVKSSV